MGVPGAESPKEASDCLCDGSGKVRLVGSKVVDHDTRP